MLGAVAGPLVAALLLWAGVPVRSVIVGSLLPALLAAFAFYGMTRDRVQPAVQATGGPRPTGLPRVFWTFTVGVALFGIGDFSRTFLILLAATTFGAGATAGGVISTAVLLYAAHNAVNAVAAYPAGALEDRWSKRHVLIGGYALGVVTNVLLAWSTAQPALLVLSIGLSGVYIAVEETLEKATAAEMLPRDQRSLGLGILAAANAVGT